MLLLQASLFCIISLFCGAQAASSRCNDSFVFNRTGSEVTFNGELVTTTEGYVKQAGLRYSRIPHNQTCCIMGTQPDDVINIQLNGVKMCCTDRGCSQELTVFQAPQNRLQGWSSDIAVGPESRVYTATGAALIYFSQTASPIIYDLNGIPSYVIQFSASTPLKGRCVIDQTLQCETPTGLEPTTLTTTTPKPQTKSAITTSDSNQIIQTTINGNQSDFNGDSDENSMMTSPKVPDDRISTSSPEALTKNNGTKKLIIIIIAATLGAVVVVIIAATVYLLCTRKDDSNIKIDPSVGRSTDQLAAAEESNMATDDIITY